MTLFFGNVMDQGIPEENENGDIIMPPPTLGMFIPRTIPVKSFAIFKKAVNKLLGGVAPDGSDEVPLGFRLDYSQFEVRNMLSPTLHIVADGNSKNIPKNKHYKFKDCADEHCGVACVKWAVGDKRYFSNVIKELKNEFEDLDNGISIENIYVLEKYFNANITIYDWNIKDKKIREGGDEYDNDVDLIFYIGEGCDSDEGHYLLKLGDKVVRQPRKYKKTYKETKTTKVKEFFLFYDLETTYNRNSYNTLEPYSCAWYSLEKGKDFKYSDKILNDCYYEDITTCENPLNAFLDWIMANQGGGYYKENDGTLVYYKHNFIITGFNNSRFDNFFLCDTSIKRGLIKNILFVNNSILNFNLGQHTSLDLCRFIASSLKGACDSFKTTPKKLDGFSHKLPQEAFELGGKKGLRLWIDKNKELLVKYNKIDVLALADLTGKYDRANQELLGADFSECNTISGLSWKCFSELQEETINPPKDHITDLQIRKSLTAGRVQCYFGRNKFIFNMRMVDVVSLYPFVMMNRKFPTGDYSNTLEYVSGKLGIYSCRIIHQNLKWKNPDKIANSFKILKETDLPCYNRIKPSQMEYAPIVYPLRSKDKPLNWDYRESMDCYLSSVDIECIIYWENNSESIFTKFLGKCMNEKNRQDELKKKDSIDYNPALREACKLVSNSLSGKVIQRNFEDVMSYIKDSKALDKFLSKTIEGSQIIEYFGETICYGKGKLNEESVYNSKKAKPSYLGIFIYAHARDYMYETLLNCYTCMYQDTDSALIPLWEYDRLLKEQGELFPFNRNKKYGDLEEEVGEANLGYTIAPKCYSVLNSKEEDLRNNEMIAFDGKLKKEYYIEKGEKKYLSCDRKLKFKGIKKSDKWELFNGDKKEYRKGLQEKTQIDNDDNIIEKLDKEKQVFTNNMMEHLFKKEKVMIYTSQLVKTCMEEKGNGKVVSIDNDVIEDLKSRKVKFGIFQRYMVKII